MIQYHPTTLAGNGLLITEGARGEGAQLFNAKGERFMEKYAPNKLELASRDVVSRAEQTEINEGRGFPDGTVALDITKVPRKRTLEALREIVNIGRDFAGVDITREPIHIKPGMHYIMGGIKTDSDGQTTIPGLYAAGEVACVSVHGGNRLGANSLLDTLVFGKRSGRAATEFVKTVTSPASGEDFLAGEQRRIAALMTRPYTGETHARLRLELGTLMDEKVGVYRDEAGLNEALAGVQALKRRYASVAVGDKSRIYNQALTFVLELGFMLDCAEATIYGAITRKESRGAQSRTDYPQRNDAEWLKHVVIRYGDGGPPKIDYQPVTITKWPPQERTY